LIYQRAAKNYVKRCPLSEVVFYIDGVSRVQVIGCHYTDIMAVVYRQI